MPRLRVESGTQNGDGTEVRKDRPCLVGSSSECDLRLTGPGVEPQHLVVKALKDGGFGVKELEGNFKINGKAIQAARIKEGDELEIGTHRLRFGGKRAKTRNRLGELGGFVLDEVLGKGGMGTVYSAEQVSLHRQVALKVLNKELTKDEVFIKRFVAEARAAARLQHKNVVHVFDVGREGDTYYLSMELMHGRSLEERLKHGGAISVDDAVQMISDAAEGLAYAESLGIVHRDIKPDNLMLDQHGHVKIADLGLATTEAEIASAKIVGTPHFMSPEQVQRKPLDHRSDLYSLGCTFYRLLTGHTPFKGSSVKEILRAHLSTEPTAPNKENPEVPSAVADVVLKLMAKDPDDRYQSADELLAELRTIQTPAAKKGLLIALAGAAVVGIGAVIWMAVHDPGKEKVTEVVDRTDPKVIAELRQSKARARFLEIKGSTLAPLERAKALEAMVTNKLYTNTDAASDATKEAGRLRAAEASKAAAAKAHTDRIDKVIAALNQTIEPLLQGGKLREAALAFGKPAIPADLAGAPKVKEHLAKLRADLKRKAKAKLDTLKSDLETARKNKNPVDILTALPKLEALLDKATGWPRMLLDDPGALRQLVRTARNDAKSFKNALANAAEQKAWADYRTVGLKVLDKAAAFDFAAAEKLAQGVVGSLGEARAADYARQLAAVMKAAQNYENAYLAKLKGAAIETSLSTSVKGGLNGKVKVLVASFTGDKPGFEVQTADGTSHTLALASLSPDVLDQLMVPVEAGGVVLKDQRLAFLILPGLVDHLAKAQTYMATLDLKRDDTGTGKAGFKANTIRLRTLLRQLGNKPKQPWASYLRDETWAVVTLIDGLRALSDRRNRAAEQSFQRIIDKFGSTIVAQRFK